MRQHLDSKLGWERPRIGVPNETSRVSRHHAFTVLVPLPPLFFSFQPTSPPHKISVVLLYTVVGGGGFVFSQGHFHLLRAVVAASMILSSFVRAARPATSVARAPAAAHLNILRSQIIHHGSGFTVPVKNQALRRGALVLLAARLPLLVTITKHECPRMLPGSKHDRPAHGFVEPNSAAPSTCCRVHQHPPAAVSLLVDTWEPPTATAPSASSGGENLASSTEFGQHSRKGRLAFRSALTMRRPR